MDVYPLNYILSSGLWLMTAGRMVGGVSFAQTLFEPEDDCVVPCVLSVSIMLC